MCGLFGSITKKDNHLTEQQKRSVANIVGGLAINMQDRGDKSTGVAVLNEGNYDMFKTTQPAAEFVESDNYIEMMAKCPQVVIGHTRLDTVGEVTPANAHPFRKGTIIGCHNGSVYNWREINAQVNVDSEVIFELIDEVGPKKAFKKIRGSFAVIWIDLRNPHAVNLVTHKNPIILAYVKELETYFWASEIEALSSTIAAVVGINKASFYDFSEQDDKVMTIDSDLHYRTYKVEFDEYQTYQERCNTVPLHTGGGNVNAMGYSEDDDITRNIERTVVLEQLKDPVWEKMINAREEDNFIKSVENKQCGMCNGEVKYREEQGFWFDWEIMMPVCIPCVTKNGLGYEETGEWISIYRFDQLLIEFYVTSKGVIGAN